MWGVTFVFIYDMNVGVCLFSAASACFTVHSDILMNITFYVEFVLASLFTRCVFLIALCVAACRAEVKSPSPTLGKAATVNDVKKSAEDNTSHEEGELFEGNGGAPDSAEKSSRFRFGF